ncbi:MAG TPA: AsmA family protein [Acetobacteraceae bacterium]|jgi:uncharacterized protein involved in outer membrane biogenesis
MPRRALRIGLIVVAVLIVLVAGAGTVFVLTFNPNDLKPRVIAAVKQATGRDLMLNGPIGLKLSLQPTVEASNVALSNPPGFSGPTMATLQKLDLQLAVLPLLHHSIQIDRLSLVKPDINLETNAKGQSNWEFAPPAATPPAATPPAATPPAAAAQPAPASPSTGGEPTQIGIAEVTIADGTLTYRDDRTNTTTTIALQRLSSKAASSDASTQIALVGAYNGTGINLNGTIGPLSRLQDPASKVPWPIDLTLTVGDAKLTVKGTATQPVQGRGYALNLQGSVPDLSALSPLAGTKLPALKSVAFQGRLSDTDTTHVTLNGFKLTTPDGDISGDASVALSQPPALTAKLASDRIDTNGLMAAMGKPVQTSTGATAAPPPKHAATGPLFPTTKLPFDLLRAANADIALTVQDLHSGRSDYHALTVHAVVRNGKLTVDPFSAVLPEGDLSATLSADASQSTPPVALTLRAPGLDVAPLLAAAGLPGYATGKLEVLADLHGAGMSPHAIAAGLDGTLGLSMQGGTIDVELLNKLLGTVLAKANLLGLLSHGGSTDLRCFAVRAVAKQGVATIAPLVLDSGVLTMDGGGTVNLGNETLDMTLRPQGRVIGTGLVVPLRVTGPMRSPDVAVNAAGAITSNAGTIAGAALTSATPLGLVGGALLGGKLGGGGSGDACASALALARGEAAPAAAPSQQAAVPAPSQSKLPNPGALLNKLFH